MASPISTNATGLQPPICAATCDGIRKIAPPITWLMPIAVRSQRPSARRSAGAAVDAVMACRRRLYRWRLQLSARRGFSRADRMHTTLPRRSTPTRTSIARELDRFYFNRWICAGRADQIPRAGDYFTRTLGDESIIVTRDGSGEVHALFNVCRHRGTRLCEAAGGPLRRSHPVPVSQLDLRPGGPPAGRAAHGAGLLQGRLPAAPRRLRGLGRPRLRAPRSGAAADLPCPPHLPCDAPRPPCAISSPICPSASPHGRWATCASAGGSSTTSRRTGS